MQKERWDGTVLDINSTYADLGLSFWHACSQWVWHNILPSWYRRNQCTKYFAERRFSILPNVLGEVDATELYLLEAAQPFVCALYGQKPGTSMESVPFALFTKKKYPKLMTLPPTTSTFLQHRLKGHLHVMLWKAADNHSPPGEGNDTTNFG